MPPTRRTSTPSWRAALSLTLLAAVLAAPLAPSATAAPRPVQTAERPQAGGAPAPTARRAPRATKGPRGTATLKVSRPVVAKGRRTALSGRLPAARGARARLERRDGKRWLPVTTGRVSATGGFRFTVRAQRGTTTYRVRTGGAGAPVLGTSVTPVRTVEAVSRHDAKRSATPRSLGGGAPADGDVAGLGVLTASGGDPAGLGALTDASAATTWSAPGTVGSWVQLDWSAPRVLTTVGIAGGTSGGQLAAATLTFSDGSRVPFGAVLPDGSRPTVVSFPPKAVTWVRVQVTRTSGAGAIALGDLATYLRGAPARTVAGTAALPPTRPAPGCRSAASSAPLVVLCPTYGATVGRQARLRLRGSKPFTSVTAEAWSGDGSAAVGATRAVRRRADGTMSLRLDLASLPAGPLTVRLTAKPRTGRAATVLTQLVRSGSPRTGSARTSPATTGRTLVFAEEFRRPVSTSRTGVGADYSSSKPESWGGADFGEAIFADPSLGLDNMSVVDGDLLRMSARPRPADYPDPQQWDREHVGAMLASARPGGSGFSAQHGYFEARMLLPAGAGTWPAFWLLPNPNLVEEQPYVAEIDALEHYGTNPQGTCHTSHQYPDPTGVGVARCGNRWDDERGALAWHTYGVDVRPGRLVYYIDGRKVATAPQVKGGDEPMFWLANLSLGGGWPIQLAGTRDRADLYVDWIRVYV